MAIDVPLDVTREFDVAAPVAEVFEVLADVPRSASHFPQVKRLTDLGDAVFRWEMEKVGAGQLSIQTVYASRYTSDRKKGSVTWEPVEGEGNAAIAGSWSIRKKKAGSHLVLRIQGHLRLPLPGLMKALAVPLVTSENERMIDGYVANLTRSFGAA